VSLSSLTNYLFVNQLRYHMNFVLLMARASAGKNALSEAKCQSVLPLDTVVTVLLSERIARKVQLVFTQFLADVYFETEIKEIRTSLSTDTMVWKVISAWTATVQLLKSTVELAGGEMPAPDLPYVFDGILPALRDFYRYVYVFRESAIPLARND
jgi:hypothetical protein